MKSEIRQWADLETARICGLAYPYSPPSSQPVQSNARSDWCRWYVCSPKRLQTSLKPSKQVGRLKVLCCLFFCTNANTNAQTMAVMVRTCCCGCDLRTGILLIGIFGLVSVIHEFVLRFIPMRVHGMANSLLSRIPFRQYFLIRLFLREFILCNQKANLSVF